MAYEHSLPRNEIIAAVLVGSVLVLGGLHFVFRSYFAIESGARVRAEVLTAAPQTSMDARKHGARALAKAKLPLGRAVSQLASGARPAVIMPQPSTDPAALEGWMLTKDETAVARAEERYAEFGYRAAQASLAAAKAAAQPDRAQIAALEAEVTERKVRWEAATEWRKTDDAPATGDADHGTDADQGAAVDHGAEGDDGEHGADADHAADGEGTVEVNHAVFSDGVDTPAMGHRRGRIGRGGAAMAMWIVAAFSLVGPWVARANAQLAGRPEALDEVGVVEHLGDSMPLDAAFHDHTGKKVTLGQVLRGDKPVVLNFAYHECPVLCNLVLNATIDALAAQQWTVGDQYEVVSISIDPEDTPASAAEKRKQSVANYGRGDGQGWHFLTGTEDQIAKAADAAGFQFKYDDKAEQYAHAAVMMLLTPDAKIARYLYGVEFNPNDVRFGLLEASEGRSISTSEQLLLYCYSYDPKSNSYVLMATRIMKIGGALTMLFLFGFLALFWRRELRKAEALRWEFRLARWAP